jgi:hypothetical protein
MTPLATPLRMRVTNLTEPKSSQCTSFRTDVRPNEFRNQIMTGRKLIGPELCHRQFIQTRSFDVRK